MTKASKADPNDLALLSMIIQIEGNIKETELKIQYAKEDEESNAAREEINIEECEPTSPHLGNLAPPLESSDGEVVQSSEYTLRDVNAITQGNIWDFRNRKFVAFDMSGDKKWRQQLLLAYAAKLTKATYFKKHLCRQEDIENHIPFDKILQVYDSKTWTNKLKAIQKHLHERILNSALVDDIMIGEWKKRPAYPKTYCRIRP